MSYLIEQKEIGNHRISIYYDECASCPITDWDLGASYLFEYNDRYHHRLHDDCDWKDWFYENNHSLEEALQRMAAKVVSQDDLINYLKSGKVDGVRFVYDRRVKEWKLQHLCNWEGSKHKGEWFTDVKIATSGLKSGDYCQELTEQLEKEDLITLINECAKDFYISEWSSIGYSQGDRVDGVAYMSKEQFDKRCGFNPSAFKDWKEQAQSVIDGEVKCIGMWMWGDVKGYVLEEKVPYTKTYADGREVQTFEWQEVHSCWGYFLETEELIDEVISEHGLKEKAA